MRSTASPLGIEIFEEGHCGEDGISIASMADGGWRITGPVRLSAHQTRRPINSSIAGTPANTNSCRPSVPRSPKSIFLSVPTGLPCVRPLSRAIVQSNHDFQLSIQFGERAERNSNEVNERARGPPRLSFSDIRRNRESHPPHLSGQDELLVPGSAQSW